MTGPDQPQQGFRHHITASIIISGNQPVAIDTHGGNRTKGSYITATFGSQLMITMLDRNGALAFARAWTSPDNRWVFNVLPARIHEDLQHMGSNGPSISVRAYGADQCKVWSDPHTRCGVLRVGGLTWYVRDRAAADSMANTWNYIAELAPTVLATTRELGRTRTR